MADPYATVEALQRAVSLGRDLGTQEQLDRFLDSLTATTGAPPELAGYADVVEALAEACFAFDEDGAADEAADEAPATAPPATPVRARADYTG